MNLNTTAHRFAFLLKAESQIDVELTCADDIFQRKSLISNSDFLRIYALLEHGAKYVRAISVKSDIDFDSLSEADISNIFVSTEFSTSELSGITRAFLSYVDANRFTNLYLRLEYRQINE